MISWCSESVTNCFNIRIPKISLLELLNFQNHLRSCLYVSKKAHDCSYPLEQSLKPINLSQNEGFTSEMTKHRIQIFRIRKISLLEFANLRTYFAYIYQKRFATTNFLNLFKMRKTSCIPREWNPAPWNWNMHCQLDISPLTNKQIQIQI
jgi:hypothetical protein